MPGQPPYRRFQNPDGGDLRVAARDSATARWSSARRSARIDRPRDRPVRRVQPLHANSVALRSHDRSQERHHDVLIGHGRSAAGRRQVIGTMLRHDLSSERVSACLADLGRTPTTKVAPSPTATRCCACCSNSAGSPSGRSSTESILLASSTPAVSGHASGRNGGSRPGFLQRSTGSTGACGTVSAKPLCA